MKEWTREELEAASAAMKAQGQMSYEEFCEELDAQHKKTAHEMVKAMGSFKDLNQVIRFLNRKGCKVMGVDNLVIKTLNHGAVNLIEKDGRFWAG